MGKAIIKNCTGGSKKTLNTGAKKQCFEGLTARHFVAKEDFKFDSVADFEDKTKWVDAIKNKDIVPLFAAYELAQENTEATFFESGNFKYETAPAIKKISFENYLGFCSHRALKTYSGSQDYTRVFEGTTKGEFIGIVDEDGVSIKGQKLSDLNVGIRNNATKEKPGFTKVSLTYEDYNELEDNPAVIKPTFDYLDIEGIFDVALELVSASSTQIKLKANVGCSSGSELLRSLVLADFVVKNGAGATQSVTLTPADADGVYTLTGTGIANGYTVNLNGVVTSGDMLYEAVEPLTISGVV